ncbi:Hypothetical_protein [Hexamita inflata]|uniref:Hypothetical_protein n=1 Tax=Hexamita inflata TaxID=28002 RepID=A0ABP1HML0_9EUKA
MQSAFTQRQLRHQICETKQESAQNCSFVCRYVFYQNYLRLSSIYVQCFLDIKTNGFPEETRLQSSSLYGSVNYVCLVVKADLTQRQRQVTYFSGSMTFLNYRIYNNINYFNY